MTINIIIPVLNEELQLERNVLKIMDFLNETELKNNYILTIIDNGSDDKTQKIATELANQFERIIFYIRLNERGVGLAFREGIKKNKCDIVGYMDLDLATDLSHLIVVYRFFNFEKIDIVVGSRLLKGAKVVGRTLKREITSRCLNRILKVFMKVTFTDAMCGFKFYRNNIAKELVRVCSNSNGWFYCAEMMIRAEWEKIKIKEVPVIWKDDPNSKVKIGRLSLNYLGEIGKLYKEKRRLKI